MRFQTNGFAWLVGPMPSMVAKDHVPDLTFAFGTQVFQVTFVFDNPDWGLLEVRFFKF